MQDGRVGVAAAVRLAAADVPFGEGAGQHEADAGELGCDAGGPGLLAPNSWSPQLGQKLGVYGPWVRDFGHGDRPEIHPCEVLWWMGENRPGVATSRLVAVVQDDSDRHDWPCDFDGPVPRPWSAFPPRANITFALRPVVQQHMQFNLRVLDAREMADIVTGAVPGMTGEFGGQPVITVTKLVDDPGKIGMGLSPVAPDPDGVHLRCFLTIDIQVSDADRGRAGHALLNLEALELGGQPSRDPRTPPGGQTP